MNRQVWVCSMCDRMAGNDEQWTHGWLIDKHKDAEKRFNGEMVIRCPDHISEYAIRLALRGKAAIK